MKKRNIIILSAIFIIIIINIILIFFSLNTSKNSKVGNNTSSQEIIDNILNINSYEAKIEVEVNSNKNTNKYIIKQSYESKDISSQEILEPSNIAGVKISKNGKQLKLENTKLNLSTIYENYEYISDNILDLISFVETYKEDEKSSWIEQNNQITMITNKDNIKRTLNVDITTRKTT